MIVCRRSLSLVLLMSMALMTGCAGTDLEHLPTDPKRGDDGEMAVDGPSRGGESKVPATDEGLFRASRDGDQIIEGVVLLSPTWRPAEASVSFSLRNDTGLELRDLVLAVVFVYPASDGALFKPRHETFEAPLRRGETRSFTIRLSTPEPGPASSFRIVPGMPEVLCPRDGEGAGTTFLSGRLECVDLEMELTAEVPRVRVGLKPRDDASATMNLEASLLLVRHDEVVWAGPWVVLPHPAAGGDGLRRLQWTLRDVPAPAGSAPYLRIRGRR